MKKRLIAILLSLILLLGILPMQALAALHELPTEAADSDYDGIPDQYDSAPNDNHFSGSYKSGDYSISLNYTMDYRNFFGDNTVYNEAIADFSTWAAQFTYENEDDETYYNPAVALRDSDGSSITKVTHIDQLMRAHGMDNVIDYKIANGYFDDDISMGAYADDDISEAYYGHHKVTYQGQTIEVVAIYVRGTNGTIQEWSSNFNVGNLFRFGQEFDAAEGKLRFPNAQWMRKTNHRGFDVCANRIRAALTQYLETFVDPDATPVFWIAGHSRGGAISNILSAYLIDEGNKVFAYTFASPNTTANTEASAAKYDCVFNLVNGDDFVPRLPMPEWGFTRYGRTAVKYACLATNAERSSYLGNTSYSYKSDSDLQELCDKFSAMTANNSGGNDGWRDVNIYHCGHQHADEQTGEYRTGCIRTRGWTELIGWGESMFTGWSQRVQRYAYWSSADNGICETPAYAMQVLAELMGNLSLSGGWDYLTTNKLADRYDFGKTSLINYATGIIDPHYMENYYLIQKLVENTGNPDSAYTTGDSLYTDSDNRPLHEHSYTFYYYDGQEPTCTQSGEGYKVCTCSQINAAWYDDVVTGIKVPALGHALTYEYVGADTHAVSCERCGENFESEPCNYVNNVCTVCGHVKDTNRTITVYVVDELDGQSLYAWAWGSAGNLDAAWPGHALSALGVDRNGHPYYSIDLNIANYDKLIFNRGGQPQTGDLNVLADAGQNDYVIYYIYSASGNDLITSQGTDIWPGPGTTTEPTCTEAGYTTYYGMFTGQPLTGNEVPALGHDYADVVVEPTCTAGGYTVHTCSRCGDVYLDAETAALGHDYVAVVTAPTAAEQGYTTHTCSRCGDSYVDSWVPALGYDYTVHFSVPAGVTKPADMISNTNTGVTLPTVEGPEGYTFLGWVLEDYDNVTEEPASILTGNYIAPSEITLKALFTYTEGGGGVVYELLTAAPADWEGNYVVTNNASTTYVLKGVTGSASGTNAESTSNCSTLAASGITLDGTTMSNVPNDYVVTLAANGSYYTVQSASTGAYFGMNSSSYLFAYSTINSTYCNWTPAINTNGVAQLKNAANGSYPYFSWSTSNNYFWSGSSNNANVLKLYKETELGTTYYTTVIGEEHVHTPGSPVTENNLEPTCTAAGSYDTVVYCAECGEELSRQTVTVPALGHDYAAVATEPTCTNPGYTTYTCSRCGDSYTADETAALGHLPGEPVQENYVEATTTAEGGYDTVVYCQRCNAELSREHTVLPMIPVTEPIETDALHIYNSISVGTDMVITFTARKNDLTNYNNFWIEVVKHNPDGDVTYTYNPDVMTEGSSTWAVQFRNIYAKEMGIDVEARLYAENAAGQVYRSPAKNANIRDYLGGRLTAANNKVEQRVLAADMLNYGAAAQMFTGFQTDHLVNEELTSDQLAKLHEYETTELPLVEKTNYNTRPEGQSNILFTSVTLGNEVLLNLTIRLAEGTEGVQVLVKNHATGAVVTTLDTTFLGSTFNAVFNGIGADAMRTEFDLVTIVNGVETGNIRTWSVEAYVGEIRAEGIALKVAMGNALLTYGDSAAAYFAAQ